MIEDKKINRYSAIKFRIIQVLLRNPEGFLVPGIMVKRFFKKKFKYTK